jgi:threonine dehydrogenase-like Zn-dependent dehydrogenase
MSDERIMSGLWLEEMSLSFRTDLPVPEPPEGEALVRVIRAGICSTDLELLRGYYHYTGIPGHEFVGLVESGPGDLEGRRVVGEINAVCGKCPACRAGRGNHCPQRTVLGIVNRDGAFAGYLLLPAANLHRVPDSVGTDEAVFTEPLAAALEIQEQVPVTEGQRVLVVGDGKLGQLIAQTLALTGCDLVVAGKHSGKMDLLSGRGIRTVYPDAVTGNAFDLAVECTGNPDGFGLALEAVRPRGTLVMKSTYASDLKIRADSIVVDEITLVGSRCGPFAPALELLAAGRLDVASLIQHRFPLEEGVAAFEKARAPGVLKVLLDLEPDAE